MSINKVVISIQQDYLGDSERKTVRQYHDLNELVGAWNEQEAKAFNRAMTKQLGIDLAMWP